ncbi:hypothetical protein DEG05_017270, partial [Xanthomonas vasicola]
MVRTAMQAASVAACRRSPGHAAVHACSTASASRCPSPWGMGVSIPRRRGSGGAWAVSYTHL